MGRKGHSPAGCFGNLIMPKLTQAVRSSRTRAAAMAHWVKLLLVMSASMWKHRFESQLHHFPSSSLLRQQKMDQAPVLLPPTGEAWIEFLVPGLCLAQSRLLQPSRA